jgi:hypothetical protein
VAAIRPAPEYINGKWWRDVTDETCGGMTYTREQIESGNFHLVSGFSCLYSQEKPKETKKSKVKPNPKDRQWKRNPWD